jgi:hypothetical protein
MAASFPTWEAWVTQLPYVISETFNTAAEVVLADALKGLERTDYEVFTKVYWPIGKKGPNDQGLSRKHLRGIERRDAEVERLVNRRDGGLVSHLGGVGHPIAANTAAEVVLADALKGLERTDYEVFTKVYWPIGKTPASSPRAGSRSRSGAPGTGRRSRRSVDGESRGWARPSTSASASGRLSSCAKAPHSPRS